MGTIVYGRNNYSEEFGRTDDSVIFDGELDNELYINLYEEPQIIFSDGTVLVFSFDHNVWRINIEYEGRLFHSISTYSLARNNIENGETKEESDIATFNTGLKWAYVVHEWERVTKRTGMERAEV